MDNVTPIGDLLVAVDRKHYEQLVERDNFLTALEAAGVDNWQGIDYAHRLMEGEEDC